MRLRILFTLFLLGLSVPMARADDLTIAAVVNDEAISNADVDARMRLALLGAGIQPPAEVLAKLRMQVLRGMLDERLELQEAAKLSITVPDSEIDEQVAQLAKQNNLSPAQLPAFFASRGVPVTTLREQIRASLAWGKVVQRKLRPKVNIGDDEVDAEVARLQANAGQPEYLVADIFLPVDSPAQEETVRQTALRLIDQMAHGARFSAIARQFSQDSSAASGGDLGWILPGQLEPQLDAALKTMKPMSVAPPVRTATGFHILMLREVRQGAGVKAAAPAAAPAADPTQAVLTLRQVLLPGATQADAAKIQALRGEAKNCADMDRLAKAQGDAKGGDLGAIPFAKLPEGLKPVLATLPENTPSPPLANAKGILFVMVCQRQMPTPPDVSAPSVIPVAASSAPAIDRSDVTNTLGARKLELLARRYLRDLRQDAFIDIRK